MTTKEQNGHVGMIKKLRRSASASEHNLTALRNRKSTQNLFDQNGIPIDLRQFRKVLDKEDNGNNIEKKTRYRRTQSVTRAEEITTKEEKQRRKQPDKSCHRPRDSLFSWSSGFSNFTGLVNWGFLLLTIGGFRLCLENLLKYGIRINPIEWFFFLSGRNEGEGYASLFLIIYSFVHLSVCLLVEKGLAMEIISESVGMFMQVTNIIVVVVLPVVIMHLKGPLFSLRLYFFVIILCADLALIYTFPYDSSQVEENSVRFFVARIHRLAMTIQRALTWQNVKNKIMFQNVKLSIANISCLIIIVIVTKAHNRNGYPRIYQIWLAQTSHGENVFKSFIIFTNIYYLVGATTVCFFYSILFLKLWSYVQVNMWCREMYHTKQYNPRERRPSITLAQLKNGYLDEGEEEKDEDVPVLVQYPDNLCYRDLFYFLCAPTLCYELNFPRTTRIRKRFLFKRLLEVVFGVNVVMALFQQWIIPSVRNSLIPFSNMEIGLATERLLKLALPNHLVWLCFFYLTFHSFLNAIGEIMHFADRNFYNDWWNANNIDTFWRTWNMPVHRWCVRHLYIPVVKMGYSSRQASTIVFLISAFFHEYLVSVPLHTYKIWAFLGMMGQIPLSAISKNVERSLGPRMGNIIVWASIILGQPLCIMMYYHDYVITHFKDALNSTVYKDV